MNTLKKHYRVRLQALQIDGKRVDGGELDYDIHTLWDEGKVTSDEIGQTAAAQACVEHAKRVLFTVVSVTRQDVAERPGVQSHEGSAAGEAETQGPAS